LRAACSCLIRETCLIREISSDPYPGPGLRIEDAIFTPRQQEIGGVFEAERADERFTVLVA
jgi:hypothetical protein